MRIDYNVTGNERKALVRVISETTGARAEYKGVPSCAYGIDCFTVTRKGILEFDDRTDSEDVEKVLEALAAAGFEGVCEGTAEPPAEEAAEAATEPHSAKNGEQTGLTVSLPMDGFTELALDNLKKLLDAKGTLIQKALGADRLTVETSEDRVNFPWWDRLPGKDETQAYMAFIAALCAMVKEAKRITATEKDVESEKYAFRCFLLRLGFIGASCKVQRKLLLKNLSGSAAFPNKAKADAFSAAQKAKRDAAKAAASAEEVTA